MGRATHSQAADGLRLVTIEAATVRCEKALIFLGHGFSRSHVRDLTIHGQVPEEVSKPYQRAGQFVQVRTIAIWTSFYVILCHFHQDGLEHWNKPSHIFEAPKIVVLLQKLTTASSLEASTQIMAMASALFVQKPFQTTSR